MSLATRMAQYARLHQFINRKHQGTPDQLAERLNLSRASFFRRLNELKDCGAVISYNKERRCYQYDEPFEISSILFSFGLTG